ncbi:MAG: CHRD domain-containing protein [Betaproteobacteria bacterium]|nr:CHRD domain-containing protein [Betaproteobacteria bacterium]
MHRKPSFISFIIACLAALTLAGCGGGGGGGDGTVAAGPIPSPITTPPPPQTWFFSEGAALTQGQMTSFDNQLLYYNVHSAANPVGEIRGQIIPEAASFATDNGDPVASNTFATLMTGDQEVPANLSKATGYAAVSFDPLTRTLTGVVVTSGVVGTVAHLHAGAPGVVAPPQIPLTGGPTVWRVPEGTILTDAHYVNVHSTAAPGGEIRGQLTDRLRFAGLSGANEVPPNNSTASGVGVLSLTPTTNAIRGFVQTTGITATVAHIHLGVPGVIGGVIVPLTQTPAGSGLWVVPAGRTLTPDQVAAFDAGNLYFNVHSAAFPVGEIRGHILAASVKIGNAALEGANEVPPVVTDAGGTGIMTVNTVTRGVQGNVFTTLIEGTVAHVHEGPLGVIGPVIIPLTLTPPASTFAAAVSFLAQVQPIFTASCTTACHTPGGIAAFLDLSSAATSFAALTAPRTPPLQAYVIAGNSAGSLLFARINGSVLPQMPLLAPPLSAADQNTIKNWIDQGAANN